MATLRSSLNILWTKITSLVDGEIPNKQWLYDEALHRLQDNDGALLGRIARVYSDLTSQATGTKAKIVGNVNMTEFNYDGGVALSGLTLIVDENTTTAQTCTFTNAVTGPDALLAQLTAQCPTNLIWSLNDSGELVSECQTIGVSSTIAVGAGTAHSLIWSSPTITSPGAGTVNDGASKIGLAAFGAWAGGTLQGWASTVDTAVTSIATKVTKAGDTMTGHLTFAVTKQVKYSDSVTRPARGKWTPTNGATDLVADTGGGVLTQVAIAQAVVTADFEFYPITGDTITAIKIAANATGSGHGSMPATKPSITLYRWVSGNIAPSIVAGPVSDPETVVVDYEAAHEVEISGVSEAVSNDTRYFLRFSSENGMNEEPGYVVTHVMLTTTSGGLPAGL